MPRRPTPALFVTYSRQKITGQENSTGLSRLESSYLRATLRRRYQEKHNRTTSPTSFESISIGNKPLSARCNNKFWKIIDSCGASEFSFDAASQYVAGKSEILFDVDRGDRGAATACGDFASRADHDTVLRNERNSFFINLVAHMESALRSPTERLISH